MIYLTFHKPAFWEQMSSEQMKENDVCYLEWRKGGRSKTCTKHFYIVAEASWQQRFESPFHSCYWEVAALPRGYVPTSFTFRYGHVTSFVNGM